jgi:hypothetical protein
MPKKNSPTYFTNKTNKSFKTSAPVHKFGVNLYSHYAKLDHFRATEKGLVINEMVQLRNKV